MCLGQARRIDGEEDVGRTVAAFVANALEQFIFLALDAVDLDAGLLGEVRVERFVGLVMAGRVEVQYFFLGLGAEGERGEGGQGQAGYQLHAANSD